MKQDVVRPKTGARRAQRPAIRRNTRCSARIFVAGASLASPFPVSLWPSAADQRGLCTPNSRPWTPQVRIVRADCDRSNMPDSDTCSLNCRLSKPVGTIGAERLCGLLRL